MTTTTSTNRVRPSLRKLALSFGVVIVFLIVAGPVAQRMSDGPTGPIPGGRLRTGELVAEADVDWAVAVGQEIELQLVEPMGSRTTGVMIHDGELYVACDLGFIWGRFSGHRTSCHATALRLPLRSLLLGR